MERGSTKGVTFAQPHGAVGRLAKLCRVLQQGFKNRPWLARRPRYDLNYLGGSDLLLARLAQFVGKNGYLLLQIGKRGAAAACGRWRVTALRPRRLAVLRFRGFPAYSVAPSHGALPMPTYHIVRVLVQNSKTGR